MGIELGKILDKNILVQLEKPEDVKGDDTYLGSSYFNFLIGNVVSLMFL